MLTGTEVKSLRNGKANLEDAYAEVTRGEVWLLGCDIPEYLQANRMNHVPKRPRKLLLHRREISKLEAKTGEKGMTLVPTLHLFQEGDRQGRAVRRQGPQDLRQARGDQETGRQARHRSGLATAVNDRLEHRSASRDRWKLRSTRLASQMALGAHGWRRHAGSCRLDVGLRHRDGPAPAPLTITGLEGDSDRASRPAFAGGQRLPWAVLSPQCGRVADRGGNRRDRRDPRRRRT